MTKSIRLSVFLALSILVLLTSACSSPNSSETNSKPAASSSEISTQNESAIFGAQAAKNDKDLTLNEMLTYAIQDEYIAHAEYEYILATFGDQKPFNNIISAEEKHIEMLRPLFDKYKTVLPADNAKDHLIIPKSIEESLKTGVQAEIDNIAMYELFLKQQLPDDVKSVFNELMNASKSHLNAFQKNLNK